MIAIPHTTDYYWLKVVQYVRTKSKNWESKLSDDYISNEIQELVFTLKTQESKYAQFGKSVKEWLEQLKTIPRINYRFILPINNVDYRKDIEFEKIKLKKITLEELKKLAPFSEEGFFTAEKEFQDLIALNDTKIFAIIDVQAKEKKQGYNLAKFNLRRLIHAMRLFDPPSGITEREFYFPETKYPYLVVNLDKNITSHPFSNLHLNAHIWRTKEYWQRVEPDWIQLKTFLYSEMPNELQSIILTALYWYGDAGKETEDDLSKFLKYLHGLESLLIFDNRYEKGKRMAERLASINSKNNPKNFDFYEKLMKIYYKFRSGMIHSGKLSIDEEDIETTHEWLRNLIFEYIRFSKNYENVADLFQNEYSININESKKNNGNLMSKLRQLFSKSL